MDFTTITVQQVIDKFDAMAAENQTALDAVTIDTTGVTTLQQLIDLINSVNGKISYHEGEIAFAQSSKQALIDFVTRTMGVI